MPSLQGQLLIASPSLVDPNFRRTVVLVIAHDDDGALGVVLNRPGSVDVGSVSDELSEVVDSDDEVYVGGPVQPTALMLLAEFDDPDDAALLAFADVGVPATGEELPATLAATRRTRVFAGHSGWGPGQLDAELEREDWIVHPAGREEVFTDDPDGLWATVLERKGGRFALLARMPADPSMN